MTDGLAVSEQREAAPKEAAPRKINRRMLRVRNWQPQSSSFWLDGRLTGLPSGFHGRISLVKSARRK